MTMDVAISNNTDLLWPHVSGSGDQTQFSRILCQEFPKVTMTYKPEHGFHLEAQWGAMCLLVVWMFLGLQWGKTQ